MLLALLEGPLGDKKRDWPFSKAIDNMSSHGGFEDAAIMEDLLTKFGLERVIWKF